MVPGGVGTAGAPQKREDLIRGRHLHLRRCVPTAIFQPVEQERREVRLAGRAHCRQDDMGSRAERTTRALDSTRPHQRLRGLQIW